MYHNLPVNTRPDQNPLGLLIADVLLNMLPNVGQIMIYTI